MSDAVGLGGDGLVELDLKLFDVFGVEGDAGGHGVAAPGFEEVGALGEGGDEVDAGDGAAGAFSGVAFLSEDEGWAMVDAGEFAGDDADDAGVPIWGVGDDGVVGDEVMVLDELEGVVGDGAFDFLAFLVHGVELFCGDGAGAEVVGEEHIDGEGGVGEAAGGVDAGAEAEGDVGGFEGLVLVDAGDFGEGLDAGAVGVLDFVEAEGGEDAVFVEERDEVGDGAKGDEVEEFLEVDGVGFWVGLFFEGFGEGMGEFEDEADGAEVGPGGVRGVEYVGVDEDGVFWGGFFGLVVVDDDDVDAFVFEEFDFGEGVGAAVEGEEEGGRGNGEGAFEDGLGHAVAFFEAEGGEVVRGEAEYFEDVGEEGGGGDAVDVVIADDGNGFFIFDGFDGALNSAVHIGEFVGVLEVGEAGVEEALGLIGIGDADAKEEGSEDFADIEAFAKFLDIFLRQLIMSPEHVFGV